MKRIVACLVIVLSAGVLASARTIELTLYPAKAAESAEECRLLPRADKLKDADAAPLYERAVASKPEDFTTEQISRWLYLPVGQFPQKEAEETVQKNIESLKLVARAARCKECNWPEWTPEKARENYSGYVFYLSRILAVWARLEMSRGGYEGTLLAIQTGFGMTRHLGQSRRMTQGLIGENVGHVMCGEVEQFMQAKDSPNLYRALASLPRPFIDLEAALENELRLAVAKDPAAKERLTEKMQADKREDIKGRKDFRHAIEFTAGGGSDTSLCGRP